MIIFAFVIFTQILQTARESSLRNKQFCLIDWSFCPTIFSIYHLLCKQNTGGKPKQILHPMRFFGHEKMTKLVTKTRMPKISIKIRIVKIISYFVTDSRVMKFLSNLLF